MVLPPSPPFIALSADVERAQDHRPALDRFGHLPVGLKLLFFARQVLAIEEHELAAEEADAVGARFQDFGHVLRQLDIGEELDRRAVLRRGGSLLQALQPLALGPELGLALAVFRQHQRVGIDDQQAALAVDDQHLALADRLEGVVQTDNRRDGERARNDRGVRGDAAYVGDKAAEAMALEADHVWPVEG